METYRLFVTARGGCADGQVFVGVQREDYKLHTETATPFAPVMEPNADLEAIAAPMVEHLSGALRAAFGAPLAERWARAPAGRHALAPAAEARLREAGVDPAGVLSAITAGAGDRSHWRVALPSPMSTVHALERPSRESYMVPTLTLACARWSDGSLVWDVAE